MMEVTEPYNSQVHFDFAGRKIGEDCPSNNKMEISTLPSNMEDMVDA